MPRHFFFSALAVHHETAIRANVEKQNYSVCPRHWYIDADFKCERCGKDFTWTAKEQKAWFEDYFFWVDSQPRHCGDCRAEIRGLADLRKEYDATVAAARNHGTPDQKKRIIEIVSELQRAFGKSPVKMKETLQLFQRQMRRAKPGGASNSPAALLTFMFCLTTMKPYLLVALLLTVVGCSPKQSSTTPLMNPELHSVIQKIAAEHLQKPVEALIPDATFSSFGADDLDLLEIMMAVEERLGITISADELTKAAGTDSARNLASVLTLRAFVAVASEAPKQSSRPSITIGEAEDGTLKEAQVGVYSELSKMPNPTGYELVFVPSLEFLIAQSEQKLRRQTSQSERDSLKARAVVIALPPAVAEEFKRRRADREATGAR